MDRDYCKVYVDSALEKVELIELLRSISGGMIEGRMRTTVRTPLYIVWVEDNEDYDLDLKNSSSGGFVYYRYYCDVDPLPHNDRLEYINAVAALLIGLRVAGFAAVPACDFEDLLPKSPSQ